MGKVVTLQNGRLVYDGLLSSKEKATIDEILAALKQEIPQVEADLLQLYGKGVLYKYNLGLFLGDLLKKYDIAISEQRKFWNEIKYLASQEDRKRDEGVNSVTRSFYQQCYVLSQIDREAVIKLSWRQWQSMLDRVDNRQDERIFLWIRQYPDKIREDDWREFEKALHLFLKNKDTSVFDTDELLSIYDSLMFMCIKWRELFNEFSEAHPHSAKIKTKGIWAKKYYARCFAIKKEQRSRIITEGICQTSFQETMK
jgi:hypothetical protein